MNFSLGSRQIEGKPGTYYVAHGAVVVGSVKLGENVGVWFNAVLRGDEDIIEIGDRFNVQDGAVLHTDKGIPLRIGSSVTIGHLAMLHGCVIGSGTTIGINAVVLNHAVIGKNCLIGANALVTERTVIPDGSLAIGSPAKVVRALRDEEIQSLQQNTDMYVMKIARYRRELQSNS